MVKCQFLPYCWGTKSLPWILFHLILMYSWKIVTDIVNHEIPTEPMLHTYSNSGKSYSDIGLPLLTQVDYAVLCH